ncbi:MAG: hypothetical protein ABIJ92_03065 [Candidatus Aenigmatarchaeota archaeon]
MHKFLLVGILAIIVIVSGCTNPIDDNDKITGNIINEQPITDEKQTYVYDVTFEATITAWNDILNTPIENVNVFMDDVLSCTTDSKGFCSTVVEAGKVEIKLQGNGVDVTQIKSVSETNKDFIFNLERKFDIIISVTDEYTNNPVEEAKVYLDGAFELFTSYNGEAVIKDVVEGDHIIRAEYKQDSKDRNVQITSDEKKFSLTLIVPKTITIKIIDSETGESVDGEEVYLDGQYKGTTIQTGEVIIEDIVPENYIVSLDRVTTLPSVTLPVVGMENYYTVNVDMPNPSFLVDLSCDESGGACSISDWVSGICKVGVTNIGQVESQSTVVLLMIYTIEDDELSLHPIASKTLNFGDVSAGESSDLLSTENICEFTWGIQEDAVAIIFDRNKYVPENRNVIQEITAPKSLINRWIDDAKSLCSEDLERCGKIAGIVVGNAIKVLI